MTDDTTPGAANSPVPGDNQPKPEAGGSPGPKPGNTDFIVSQEQFNQRWAEKTASLEKELGIPIKEAKALIAAKKAADEANKTELEKLTSERDKHKTEAAQARAEAIKLRALARAGAGPDKIDALIKRVVGSTPEEIEADVKELQTLGLLQTKPPGGAQGAGNPGVPPKAPDPTLDEQIAAAEKAGNASLAIALKLKKQGL